MAIYSTGCHFWQVGSSPPEVPSNSVAKPQSVDSSKTVPRILGRFRHESRIGDRDGSRHDCSFGTPPPELVAPQQQDLGPEFPGD